MTAGCVSKYPPEVSDVLRAPHKFTLVLEKQSAHPGDIVMAHLEFINLGPEVLWVPERSQFGFGFDSNTDSIGNLAPSACGGITYKRVATGKRLSYAKGFQVPYMPPGVISVYVFEERGVKVPFTIE
jgi:hypothetical protein